MQNQSPLQVSPTTLTFMFPHQIRTNITFRNVSLHQLFIKILPTNPDNYIIHPQSEFRMQAFDQKIITIHIKYYQQALLSNYLGNKFIIYSYDCDQQGQDVWNTQEGIMSDKMRRISQMEIFVNPMANMQDYAILQPKKKQSTSYVKITKMVGKSYLSFEEKTLIIQFLQTLGDFIGIQYINNKNFIASFKQLDQNIALIKEIEVSNKISLYSFFRLPVIFKEKIPLPTSIQKSLNSINKAKQQILKTLREQQIKNEEIQIQQIKQIKQNIDQQIIKKNPGTKRLQNTETFAVISSNGFNLNENLQRTKKKNMKKRNRSLQILKQQDNNEDQQQKKNVNEQNFPINKQLFSISNYQNKVQINKQSDQLVHHSLISCLTQPLALCTSPTSSKKIYILFEEFLQVYDCIQKMRLGKKILLHKKIQIQKEGNIKLMVIMKQLDENRLGIGFDSSFYIIDLTHECCQYIYVQRKQIYDFTHIYDRNLVAVGGRNFSKLSYFGKNTSRSNIKIYSFTKQPTKHLFTYDLQGSGDVIRLQYMKIQSKNILFVGQKLEKKQTIYLVKVHKWNDLQVLNRLDLQDLAIHEVIQYRFLSEQVFALQSMIIPGNDKLKSNIMFIKKLKIKVQPENINKSFLTSISTQSLKFSPQIYNFFQSDQDSMALILYCQSKQKLIIKKLNQKQDGKEYELEKGFRKIRIKWPFILLMFDGFVEIKKII